MLFVAVVCFLDDCMQQDKVGDFSGFTPDKLLLETEKALSHDTLYQPHLQLMEMQDDVS